MRLRLISLLGIVGLALGLLVAPVGATTVIDFSTGNAGYGGIVSLFSDGNLSGAGIPVGTVTIVGAPQNNSTYGVSGPANSSYGGFVGSLTFQPEGSRAPTSLESSALSWASTSPRPSSC